jgi:biotin carboxylase
MAFTFIGPTAEHIRMMGDKIVAKQTAHALGLPLVPGSPVPSARSRRSWHSATRSAGRC